MPPPNPMKSFNHVLANTLAVAVGNMFVWFAIIFWMYLETGSVLSPAYSGGIFMVAMTLLGGKGTLWGPVVGATLFYTLREVTWTYLLGWQYIALGVLIIVNVVYFQQGIMGWLKARRPQWFS